MLPWVCTVMNDSRRQNVARTLEPYSAVMIFLFLFFFWHYLWSITEQTHRNMISQLDDWKYPNTRNRRPLVV